MSTSSLHKLPPGSTLGSVPVDIRFYEPENPGASNRAGVVRSRAPGTGMLRGCLLDLGIRHNLFPTHGACDRPTRRQPKFAFH